MLDRATFDAIVADAMLAPSAHNTQPVRWRQTDSGISVFADTRRRLPVGDPDDRDLKIACGAAVEGTVLALASNGVGADVLWLDGQDQGNLRPIATVTPHGVPQPDDVELAQHVKSRVTHRTGFMSPPEEIWAGWKDENITLVTNMDEIKWLAHRIDHASAAIMRDKEFRKELLHWMRLASGNAAYHKDGLNREALAMDWLSSALVAPVLGTKLYDLLSRIGLGPALSGEATRTSAAGAVALLHWPAGGSMFEAGRAFYRYWLVAASKGLVGWPAAALADDPATSAAVAARFDILRDRVLVNAIRLGHAKGKTPDRTRLTPSEVIV